MTTRTDQPEHPVPHPRSGFRVGLALAGGGPEGAVYEIGALRALDDAIDGLDLNDVDIYVGVSAGAFIASCIANGMSTAQLCRAIVKSEPGEHPFNPETFFSPAIRELFSRSLMAPRLAAEAVWDYINHPDDLGLLESLGRLTRALPVGLFDNEPVRKYLERIFAMPGRTDDFRDLGRKLVVVAADLDSGQSVRFGVDGHDHVPISRAVQASTALPGLYPPVPIDGRFYVDGVLLKTLHASVALEAGADLVLCVNPIVPVDTADAVREGIMRRGHLVNRGLPTVLSQTFRTLVHSRLSVGLNSYEPRYPGTDVILFEPSPDDYRMFFTNIFRFSSRKAVCEHAYRSMLRQLRDRRDELAPVLERHGLRFDDAVLDDLGRDVWTAIGYPDESRPRSVTESLDLALSRLERVLGTDADD